MNITWYIVYNTQLKTYSISPVAPPEGTSIQETIFAPGFPASLAIQAITFILQLTLQIPEEQRVLVAFKLTMTT